MQSVSKNQQQLHQIKADLIWLTQTPSLVRSNDLFLSAEIFHNTTSLDINNPQHRSLAEEIFHDCKNTVGDYFERLVLLWLKLQAQHSKIQQHIRIYENKRTVGELDFLFSDVQNHTNYHWEAAVKFYLLTKKNNTQDLIGPNAKDTFKIKYNKLVKQQLTLSQSELVQPYLEHLQFKAPISSKGLLKGYLFYPTDEELLLDFALWPMITPDHLKGWWTTIKTLNIPAKNKSNQWLILKKPYWFTLPEPSENTLLSLNDVKTHLSAHFAKHRRAVLLAELMQINGQWQEVSRGFVVDATWPQS